MICTSDTNDLNKYRWLIFLANRSYYEYNRQDRLPGEDTMLDRPGLFDAVEDLHELGQRYPLYSTHSDNRGLLCCDRCYYMVAGRGSTPGTY